MANSDSRRITRTIPATQMVALLLAFLLAATAGGVLAAGFVIPAVAGANAVAQGTTEIYDEVPSELEPQPLSQQSRIYAANGKLLATFYYQNRIVVPIDKISENMQHAVIAIEDERFYEHNGVDAQGISRAVVNNLTSDDLQGASTITQQYVKNTLIESALQEDDQFALIDAYEDSIDRKLREAKMAIALEKKMSKDEILQGYLNVAQFGYESIYGVESASRYYFDKSASDLNVVEAATIAGVTKSPSNFDPTRDPEQAKERRDAVIQNMWKLGYITGDQRDEAQAKTIEETLNVQRNPAGCQTANNSAFFCDYVIKELLLDPTYGETRADRQELLYQGGLDIHTTLDMKKQRQAFKTIKQQMPEDDSSNLEASIVTVEPGTGKILTMAQNVPYSGTKAASNASRDTTVNYNADYVHGASGGFQVGSNFKPVVLAQWLKEGHTLLEQVTATKVERVVNTFDAPCQPITSTDTWAPANAEGVLSGTIPVLEATYLSVNTAYASMGHELNLCGLRDTAWEMGYRPTSSSYGDNRGPLSQPATKSDIDIFAPMIVGTQESSPMNMAATYATLASGGTYCTPMAITGVTGPNGEEYEVDGSDCDKNALPSDVANTIVYAMENVFTRGTAYSLGGLDDGRPVAGKTGTSQLSTQTWFTGFTPQLSTSVWVGTVENATEDHTNGMWVNGNWYDPLYGSSVAAPAWKTFMDQAVEGMPVEDFGSPSQTMIGTPPAPPTPATPEDDGDDDSSEDSGDTEDSGDSGDSDEGSGGNDNGGGNGGGGNGGGNGGDDD